MGVQDVRGQVRELESVHYHDRTRQLQTSVQLSIALVSFQSDMLAPPLQPRTTLPVLNSVLPA